ncbi:hypothetical protein NECAME_02460 [Necator americanus]|uniref:Endonuclease/exonuclease/phosphatase domain-containing protein n=1 Tax=Necator americanus TaxID=51031 RepID=W2TDS8_NECAM|nr:hypothetical protein NECAME_02460 [Necator americanus]ETN79983.1 hypothetical protein NECAME_02460 [Necator americanus]
MAICTYNARTLASEAAIEDLMMQAKKIKYDVIGLTETRRGHPLNAVYETGEELFLGKCDSRSVGGVGVLVNTSMAKNIDSFEQLTTRIGRNRRIVDATVSEKKRAPNLPSTFSADYSRRQISNSLYPRTSERAIVKNYLPTLTKEINGLPTNIDCPSKAIDVQSIANRKTGAHNRKNTLDK